MAFPNFTGGGSRGGLLLPLVYTYETGYLIIKVIKTYLTFKIHKKHSYGKKRMIFEKQKLDYACAKLIYLKIVN